MSWRAVSRLRCAIGAGRCDGDTLPPFLGQRGIVGVERLFELRQRGLMDYGYCSGWHESV